MSDFTNRAVLVTGSARRLGRAIARHLAAEGWDVGIHFLTSSKDASEFADELKSMGRKCCLYKSDLRSEADIQTMVNTFKTDFATPILLVNSASIFKRDRVETLDAEIWDDHMRVNALAPTLLTKYFCASVTADANVINILDQKVSWPTPDFFSYTVSKTALATITRLLAMEYHGRCRVNAVAPGLTLQSGDQTAEEFKRVHSNTPLGVGPTVDEICQAVSFLANARSVTGQIITIDGGRHLLRPIAPFNDLPKE